MYKKIIILLLLILWPFNVLGYSNYVIPGGENIGIEIYSDGITIIGFYKVEGKYNKGEPELKVGDKILKVNDKKTSTINELIDEIDLNLKEEVVLTIKRGNEEKSILFPIIKINDIYKTGLYVKDSLTGIGALTYIDPNTLRYGALGHEIIEKTTNERVEVKMGTIFKSDITSIDRSTNGNPGGKNAKFFYNKQYGNIVRNTDKGIYGTYEAILPDKELMAVGDEVSLGKAMIQTVLDGNKITQYAINITKINTNHETKNIVFEVVDEELLQKTGGIVQGMSGSPIIQENKIVGAVTHVVVDNVSKGYGIFITSMLEEGDK